MNRRDDWSTQLVRCATALRGAEFVWGETDCAQVVLECLDAMFETTLAAEHRHYRTELGALRYQRRHPQGEVLEALGGEWVTPGFQQRGDVILCPGDRWEQVHLCLGADSISSAPETGVAMFSTEALLAQPGAKICRL